MRSSLCLWGCLFTLACAQGPAASTARALPPFATGRSTALISAELIPDAPIRGPAGGLQATPRVAFNGAEYLVVWADTREYSELIGGSRVALDGTVVDPNGLTLSVPSSTINQAPDVASDGNNFFVSWIQLPGSPGTVVGALFAPDGTEIADVGALSNSARLSTNTRVVFGSNEYFVVWEEGVAGAIDVHGARIAVDGTLLDPGGFAIAGGSGNQMLPTVAAGPSQFLVMFHDQPTGQDEVVRVSSAGAVLDGAGIPLSSTSSDSVGAFDGTNYLVTWTDSSNATPDVYGARISPSGTVLDPSGIAIATLPTQDSAQAVLFDGAQYQVLWLATLGGTSGFSVTPVTTAGAVGSANPISSIQNLFNGALAGDAAHRFAVWGANRPVVASDIYGTRIDATNNPLDPAGLLISQSANQQTNATVCFEGGLLSWGWLDGRQGAPTYAFSALIDPSETISGVGPLVPTLPVQGAFTVACAPGVRWVATPQAQAVRYLDTGAALGSPVSPTFQPLNSPFTAAALGTDVLVAWSEGTPAQIKAARLDSTGTDKDSTPLFPAPTGSPQFAPQVTSVAGVWWIAWIDQRTGADVYGARVDSSGTLLDPGGVPLDVGAFAQSVALASNGNDRLLVVWAGGSGAATLNMQVRDASGVLLTASSVPLATAPGFPLAAPAATFDGQSFVVAWHQGVAGVGTQLDVAAARITSDGVLRDTTPLTIANSQDNEVSVAVTSDGAGRTFLAYQRFDSTPSVRAWRVRGRILTDLGTGSACTSPDDCASGFCVDGVCCNATCAGGTGDCQACSVAAGAALDGVCGPVAAGNVCRGAASSCDAAEHCDGVQLACPADGSLPDGAACAGGGTCVAGACAATARRHFTVGCGCSQGSESFAPELVLLLIASCVWRRRIESRYP